MIELLIGFCIGSTIALVVSHEFTHRKEELDLDEAAKTFRGKPPKLYIELTENGDEVYVIGSCTAEHLEITAALLRYRPAVLTEHRVSGHPM